MQSFTGQVFVLAVCASLAFSFLIFPSISESQKTNIDVDRFGLVARNLAEGNGFVYEKGGAAVLERTPLYPSLIALLFKLGGISSLPIVQLLQAFLHGLTAALLFRLAATLFDTSLARAAAISYSLHPLALWYTSRIWVETLMALMLVIVTFALISLLREPSVKRAISFGVAGGLVSLTKGVMLLLPVAVLLLLTLSFGRRGAWIGLIITITSCAIVLPWALRNYFVSNAVVPVNTSLGLNLIQGNTIGSHWLRETSNQSLLDFWNKGKAQADSLLAPSGLQWESAKGDRILVAKALQAWWEDPAFFIRRLIANLVTFWYLTESFVKSMIMGLLQGGLALLATIGLWRASAEERKQLLPVVLVALYFYFMTASVVGYGRYSVPLAPLLTVIALPLVGAAQHWSSQRKM